MSQAANLAALGTNAGTTGVLTSAAMPTGSVLQVVSATYSTSTTSTSTTPITTGLTASITPKFSTSKILVLISDPARRNSGSQYGAAWYLYRNGSSVYQLYSNWGYSGGSTIEFSTNISMNYLDSPATTSATTYALYFNAFSSGTSVSAQIDGTSANTGVITLLEIAA